MRRPRRKAAEETQKRVTTLLANDAALLDREYSVSDEDEVPAMESVMPTRGGRKKPNTPSNSISGLVFDENNRSEREDSDFEVDLQISDDDEIIESCIRNSQERTVPLRNPQRTKTLQKKRANKTYRKQSQLTDDTGECIGTIDNLNWKVWEKELQNWGPWANDGEVDLDALAQKKGPAEEQEPPPELLMPLLPFQKEWLAWSLKQEESESKGGILADEMGMGKTIQAISLVLASHALRIAAPPTEYSSMPPNSMGASSTKTKVLTQVKTTLVVCPKVAVTQWRNEIARFTAKGSTKVLVYHGTDRCKDVAELSKYDIILTTYSIVESEYRKKLMPGKEKCEWCGKLYTPDRLSVHQRYYCGPTALKTEKQAKQVKKKLKHLSSSKTCKNKINNGDEDSKIVSNRSLKGKHKSEDLKKGKIAIDENSGCPSATIRKRKLKTTGDEGCTFEDISSDDEGKSRSRGTKKKSVHHDNSVHIANKSSGSSIDIGSSILHSVKWGRIILDEAHYIKDRRCSTSKAVFALESSYKWALSGTPLQNRVGELYSLVRFLQIYPYSYYFCKQCDCQSLDYSFGKDWQKCDVCDHSPMQHFCWWNKFVANPIKKRGYTEEGQKALILLKHKVLDGIVLRRTKIERAAEIALPPRIFLLRRDTFDTKEEDFYQALYTQSQSQFNTYITAGTLLNNYAHIFDLLTRLRQAVDHPYLVVYSKTSSANPNNQNSAFDSSSANDVCGLCHYESDNPVSATCGHTFCRDCVQEYISTSGQSSCPSCLKPLTIDLNGRKNASNQDYANKVKGYKRSSIMNCINLDNFQTSTKIDALREEIAFMLQKDAAAKAIVFSQFTSFLDLINFCLQKSGIKCVQLDGSMSIQARDLTIEKFTNDPYCKVFLMSLKAGGVALNLTVASHVFLMDPWWNPAVEQQAQDRIHRLGQYKPIRVVRFVIANTIEERILRLQEKKQLVFEGTVGGSLEALGRLTEEDLRFLFTN